MVTGLHFGDGCGTVRGLMRRDDGDLLRRNGIIDSNPGIMGEFCDLDVTWEMIRL